MTQNDKRWNRSRFLKGGLLAAAGTAGVGAAAGAAGAAPAVLSPQPSKPQALTLEGRGWHASVPGKRFGQLPRDGETFHVHGELVDAKGRVVGEFLGRATHVQSPFAGSRLGVTFENHVLQLGGGTLFATGHSANGEGSFAIVGGTGSYAGAAGGYSARQSVHGLGGDGTARISITLTTG